MNILVVTQYFWPETFIINQLVSCLRANDHKVEVATGKPNYPEGEIFEGYKAFGYFTECFEGLEIHRIPVCPRGKTKKKLLLNYLSFILSGLYYFRKLLKKKTFDAIVVFAPSPITSVIPALYLKRLLPSQPHLAVWVQDLWPESVEATGMITSGFLIRQLGKVVRQIYKSCDTLLVQSKAFPELMKPYAPSEKIVYYPNSWLEPQADPLETEPVPLALLQEFEQNHCFVFAGNFGTAQALETIIQAAEYLIHLPQCKLILLGSGKQSELLKTMIENKKLNNILLPGRFSSSVMPGLFSKATALLVTLKKDPLFSCTIPSKIQAYLASGRPILAALDGEGARIILEAEAGLVSPAEDARALAKNIEQLYHMTSSELEQMGKAGRAYFLEHFEMRKQSQRLIEILTQRIREKEKSE